MSKSTKRHPLRGLFGGLFLGLGAALLLLAFGVLALKLWYLVGLVAIGAIIGLVLAFVAPARTKTATPPTYPYPQYPPPGV